MVKNLRIHGDNIIECERTLKLISEALKVSPILDKNAPIYMPVYNIKSPTFSFRIVLLSGHERWGINIGNVLEKYGGVLREGADSYITELVDKEEKLLLAIEYCSALPAGNNAWQRNGRAFSSILAGVPYLYYAEIGGAELDEDRNFKAPRFPNPIVPFSYISSSHRIGSNCIPVYRPHPSIPSNIYRMFKHSFGIEESENVIRCILLDLDYTKYKDSLNQKCMSLISTLSMSRRTRDTLKDDEWQSLYDAMDADEWLSMSRNSMVWNKKFSDKVAITNNFSRFKDSVLSLGCLSIGAKDIPICLVPKEKIGLFNMYLHTYFPSVNYSFDNSKNLAIVWIVGYKPRGDDSRPDRGLTSLARMVLGNKVNILTLVYGPARPFSYSILSSLNGYESNGMWASVIKLSDFVLFDSVHYPKPIFHVLSRNKSINKTNVVWDYVDASLGDMYGEHDIDTTIHQIFGGNAIARIKECFCNPPGGDWSGISYFTSEGNEYRWTSLPRVSSIGGKRPDHIIQVKKEYKDLFLSIESKGLGSRLEDRIGINLKNYIDSVYSCIPTAIRAKNCDWINNLNPVNIPPYSIISIGAFLYNGVDEMYSLLHGKELDAIIAVEFKKNSTILHVTTNSQGNELVDILKEIQSSLGNFVISID